ncbi:oligoendopeptidase, M3 family [Desulfitobacterium dehalogenans ATCC 51507]|uniref:Oligoendopeptidase, M3 family n=1 Tax=Desulfitobacterium dehalogenans (strain ATCC 51507 / DSM 9161 / JW/IU-DC1) TaxID=756499 RepID=I4A9U4_DESDJ|nr:M3 family oligoendopeptidase [Desulfitobacterium dehalogenans]AFM00729.1 oligoendopeptidase, M3 family [Desulfitobacterium dehalogenans ATCC 51507]
MKFEDFPYSRPDMEKLKGEFKDRLEKFKRAEHFHEQDRIFMDINRLRGEFDSMSQIASIRQTIDTNDAYYEREQEFFDENLPIYQGLISEFYQVLIDSPFRQELEHKWGKQLFRIAELTLKTFIPEIIEDLQVENKLSTEYTKLIASAKIFFEGEERNLSGLGPFLQSTDPILRKRANEAKYAFFEEHEETLDTIYDQLVKVRTRIAWKLGYPNYVGLGYARMLRSDYDSEMVSNFRKQVQVDIVPIASRLRERQRKRLGLENLFYYDEKTSFNSGNPKPHGEPNWIIEQGRRMYKELSTETEEFFEYMVSHELMDLVTKKGKAGGGYCTYVSKHQAPFIFSNFNGTSGDVDVLTHEAGHAFQVYSSRHHTLPEYQWPTYESCEIHSMSMEFFAWPWMELFFEEEADKYRFHHLSEALLFIPYGVSVDEFQHFVYENPDATPAQRKAAWRGIERKYLPHRNYEGNTYLEGGGYWHQQGHIFGNPFYYIDYTLAQICAFQFWQKSRMASQEAWQDYLSLCRVGGSMSFLDLVDLGHLISPFQEGCIKSVVEVINQWLEQVDDRKF